MDAHLRVDVGKVALYGRLGEVQRGGYLVVGEAAGGEKQDLKLPGREDALDPLPVPSSISWGIPTTAFSLAGSSTAALTAATRCSEEEVFSR